MADNGVLRRKAYNAQLIYEDLLDRLGMEGIPTTFVADEGRRAMLSRACFSSKFTRMADCTRERVNSLQCLWSDM